MSRCVKGRSGHWSARLLRESIHTLNWRFIVFVWLHFTVIYPTQPFLIIKAKCTFTLLEFGPVDFRFKGCWMIFFIFIQILIVFIVFLKQTVETLIRHRVKVIIVIYRKNETILILISLKTLFFASWKFNTKLKSSLILRMHCLFVCFVALRPKSTAMVRDGQFT